MVYRKAKHLTPTAKSNSPLHRKATIMRTYHVSYYQIAYRRNNPMDGRCVYGETTVSAQSANQAVYVVESAMPHVVILCCIAA